jgi:cobalamin biosynthesis Mg chelatase CobN
VVSDGKLSDSHEWTVDVENVLCASEIAALNNTTASTTTTTIPNSEPNNNVPATTTGGSDSSSGSSGSGSSSSSGSTGSSAKPVVKATTKENTTTTTQQLPTTTTTIENKAEKQPSTITGMFSLVNTGIVLLSFVVTLALGFGIISLIKRKNKPVKKKAKKK